MQSNEALERILGKMIWDQMMNRSCVAISMLEIIFAPFRAEGAKRLELRIDADGHEYFGI